MNNDFPRHFKMYLLPKTYDKDHEYIFNLKHLIKKKT